MVDNRYLNSDTSRYSNPLKGPPQVCPLAESHCTHAPGTQNQAMSRGIALRLPSPRGSSNRIQQDHAPPIPGQQLRPPIPKPCRRKPVSSRARTAKLQVLHYPPPPHPYGPPFLSLVCRSRVILPLEPPDSSRRAARGTGTSRYKPAQGLSFLRSHHHAFLLTRLLLAPSHTYPSSTVQVPNQQRKTSKEPARSTE